jgi:AhpC/TSA family
VLPSLLFTALLQEPAATLQEPAATARTPLLDDCSSDGRVLATLSPSDPVQVRSSRAGEAQTCYTVNARIGGQDVVGYVLGDALPAVKEFDRERTVIPPPALPVAAVASTAAVAPAPTPRQPAQHFRKFGNFSATDVRNRPVSLSSQAKLILVCFWSPNNQESSRELIVVSRLYGQLHKQGLDAVGISLDLSRAEILDSMVDFSVAFPNIADHYGLAGREGVSFDTLPATFILNQQHEVVASGLHKANLESTVLRLMKEQ